MSVHFTRSTTQLTRTQQIAARAFSQEAIILQQVDHIENEIIFTYWLPDAGIPAGIAWDVETGEVDFWLD